MAGVARGANLITKDVSVTYGCNPGITVNAYAYLILTIPYLAALAVNGSDAQVLQVLTVSLPCLFVGSDYKAHGIARGADFVMCNRRNFLPL